MSDGRLSRRRPAGPGSRSWLWSLGIAVLVVLSAGLLREAPTPSEGGSDNHHWRGGYRRDLRSYIWGLSLALALTLIPFALVLWSAFPRTGLLIAIGVSAFVQMIVHFRFFLHIDPPRQNTDDLHLILFSSLILFFMAGGTLWIMFNLAWRMMPP